MSPRTKERPAPQPVDDPSPIELARQETLRGDRMQLAAMRDEIARRFGIYLELGRLEPVECGELLKLHKMATRAEGWEAGVRHYGLTRLDGAEQRRWRELVGKAAGHPGLLDDIDEDGRVALKIRELVQRATAPPVSAMVAPKEAAAGVLEDVHAGELFPLDLVALGVVIATFASGRLHPRARGVRFEGDVLLAGDRGRALLPEWDPQARGPMDFVVSMHFANALDRLCKRGWLEVAPSGAEARIRLGPRLTGTEG